MSGPEKGKRLLVSACLLGLPCRYDGRGKKLAALDELREKVELVPFCPEQMGGLPTPRPPAERVGDRVQTNTGADVTEAYARGGALAVEVATYLACDGALLKAKSPACGVGEIYDGSFSGCLVPGDGVAAQALRRAGLPLFREDQVEELLAMKWEEDQ